jgi:hypothetical protein
MGCEGKLKTFFISAADRCACQLHALTNVSLKKQPTSIYWTGGRVNPRDTLGCSNNYNIYNKKLNK